MSSTQASNSEKQNPCEIAGALEAPCEGFCAFKPAFQFPSNNSRSVAVYELGTLSQGTNYVAPQKNNNVTQGCQCNTVMYRYMITPDALPEQALTAESCSLYMACTACQNVTIQSWTFWSQYCGQVFVTQYPGAIPLNTSVPHWAYLNVTVRAGYLWWGAYLIFPA